MKNKYIIYIITICLSGVSAALFSQNVAINTSGNNAYISAILDLSNNNTAGQTGLLPPYVTLTSLNAFTLLGAPASAANSNGMIVYNTGGAVPAGLYYWNNTSSTWVAMGGVNSITGTAPIVVTPTSGTPVVSLQGTAGGVFYGTGGGSNITTAGTSGQYLMSNGAAAPTWQTIYSSACQTHQDYSTLFASTTTAATEFSTASASFVNVTGNTLPLALSTAGTYLIISTAELYSTSATFGTEITLTDGTHYWGTSVPYVYTFWTSWSTQAVVTIAASTTYNIQVAAHAGSTTWVRNATITAIRVN
ncbi:MAG TPA: hypothetical protein VK809_02425 [Bacteroidia bacterium]|nr:hypothetical protein [Bacteroidia bacterium]